MSYTIKEIKKGIKLHLIDTKKFKTNLITVMLTMPLSREAVTLNTVIPAVLKRGTNNLNSQEEISKKLEDMYGAEFDCGIEKIGDNHSIKFYLETLNDNFIPQDNKDNLAKNALDLIFDIIFNPYTDGKSLKNEYVELEKNNIKQLIESKIDNKNAYALNRCIEEMYKNEPYGLYKYGYVEDLANINSNNLYEYYKKIINTAKIDIFFSGDIQNEKIEKYVAENKKIAELPERNSTPIINNKKELIKQETKSIEEKMEITQGKLILGLDVASKGLDSKFPISIYNVILRRKCNI